MDILGRSAGMESAGSLAGMPSAHCPGTPCQVLPGHRTAVVPGHPPIGTQSGAAEVAPRQGTVQAGAAAMDRQGLPCRLGWLELPARLEPLLAHVPPPPCAGLLLPSYAPSTACGFP